jgi:hypothetical protein
LARNPKAKPMSLWFLLLCAFMLMAYAAIGGIFLAFSDFIMRSFDLVRNQAGIETMQVLNVEIMRSIFMVLFMGLAILSLVIMVYAALQSRRHLAQPAAACRYFLRRRRLCRDRCRQCAAQQSACSSCAGHIAGSGFLEGDLHDPLGRSQQLEDAGLFPGVGVTLAALIIR